MFNGEDDDDVDDEFVPNKSSFSLFDVFCKAA
jgi:hypothetical protein